MPSDLTAERLRELLSYNPETGEFRWKAISGNRAKLGALAGHVSRHSGYRIIGIDGKEYRGARLAWLYVHGRWPTEQVDHYSCDRADDRISNLREASLAENNRNIRAKRNNKSGIKGAYWIPKRSHWRSSIMVNRRWMHLGHFATAEEAHAAYCKASTELHGQFARTE